jgi:hypothetical protein
MTRYGRALASAFTRSSTRYARAVRTAVPPRVTPSMVRTVLRRSCGKGEFLDRTFAHPTKPARADHEIVIPISEH